MRLQHVALETRHKHVEAEINFWALLGFAEVEHPVGLAARSVWLQHGDAQVHLLFARDPYPPPEGHAAFVADDYEAVVAALRAAGFDAEDREAHWGAPRCFVRSPNGHRVELMAVSPGQQSGAAVARRRAQEGVQVSAEPPSSMCNRM